jgi:hypothetical protein
MVTTTFEAIARLTLASEGIAEHPLVLLPAHAEFAGDEELKEYAQQAVRDVFPEMFAGE